MSLQIPSMVCKQSDGVTGFPPVAWSVAGPFIQRKLGHIKKKRKGEKVVEGKIEWDLAEKSYDEHRLCGSDILSCLVSGSANHSHSTVYAGVKSQALGSTCNSSSY